jgi:hypothetical protein
MFDRKSKLDKYLAEQSKTPFIWGKTDCCHFVAGAAEAMTGKALAEVSVCESIADTLRVFLEHDRDVGKLADRYFKRINSADVSYGDIVAVRVCIDREFSAFGDVSLGLFLGDSVAVKTADGVLNVKPVFAAAWRVE